MTRKAVLLDTSFFLRFLNDASSLFNNADRYFRYFFQDDIIMMISTISIAEFCVGGDVNELPLKNLQPFPSILTTPNVPESLQEFQNKNKLKLHERNIIPNHTKLFAQADTEVAIAYYLSSNTESHKIYNLLKEHTHTAFQFIDLNIPYSKTFGVLGL